MTTLHPRLSIQALDSIHELAAQGYGGQQIAERQFLHFRRVEESSADAAAVTFLTRAHESARGLVQFLKILNQRETIMMGHVDPYVLTHPLTPERIAALQGRVEESPYYNTPFPASYQMPYERMKAKLTGFLDSFDETMRRYPPSDRSIPALYARAIAYYRIPELDKPLPIIDGLIRQFPDDPYFRELKGQMLFENGRVADAEPHYRRAVELLVQALSEAALDARRRGEPDPLPADRAEALWKALLDAGRHDGITPIGPGARATASSGGRARTPATSCGGSRCTCCRPTTTSMGGAACPPGSAGRRNPPSTAATSARR